MEQLVVVLRRVSIRQCRVLQPHGSGISLTVEKRACFFIFELTG